jgi:hypothetical protein
MKYEKPYVICLDNAGVAIQSTSKAVSMTTDSKDEQFLVTVTAYESDE